MGMQDDNFTFFVDNVTLEKGKDSQGKEVMKVGGIASTKAKDTDEEEIDQNGWDIDYFVKSGFFNYNHQSKFNPKAVIGEPTKAEVRPDGVWVEGYLYPDSELAKSVYETTEMLQKSSSNRRMGFSIEGKALERDPFNEKKITKARLTGCALTLNPKNPNTLVNILKGEYHTDEFEYDMDNVPTDVKEELEKAEDYIIHLERDGKTIQVDRDLNIKITDRLQAEVEKSLSAGGSSGEAVSAESVDQEVKNSERLPDTKKNLTKGEVYSEIFNYIYDQDLEKADLLYQHIQATAIKRNTMSKTENNTDDLTGVSTEDIQKSLDSILNAGDTLEKGGDSKTTKKGEDTGDDDKDKDKEGDDKDSPEVNVEIEKALDEDEEYQKMKKALDETSKKMESYKKEKMEKAVGSAKKETMQSDQNAASMGKEGEFISKSQVSDLIKGIEDSLSDSLEKGFSDTTGMIQSLAKASKSLVKRNDDLEKSLDSYTTKNDDLQKSLDSVVERLDQVEKQSPGPRSVTTDSYRKHPTLEKSEDGGASQLHVQHNREEILNILDQKAGLDGNNPNMRYAQSMAAFESSGALEKGVIADLEKSEGVQIVGL